MSKNPILRTIEVTLFNSLRHEQRIEVMVNIPSRSELTAPFRSKEAFVNFVKTSDTADGQMRVGNERWSNKDLEPTPPEHRNWTW